MASDDISDADRARCRAIFAQLKQLVDQHAKTPEDRKDAMRAVAQEFSMMFNVTLGAGPDSPARCGPRMALRSVCLEDVSAATRYGESWSGGYLDGTDNTLVMNVCSGWRSLASVEPITDSLASFSIEVQALRTLTIGVSVGSPELYVGDSESSWAYQSTGHMIHAGRTVRDCVAPKFEVGDKITMVVDRDNGFIAFYKNGQLAGVPFDGLDTTQPLHFALSCYLGPCNVRLDAQPMSREHMQKLKSFPIFIGA